MRLIKVLVRLTSLSLALAFLIIGTLLQIELSSDPDGAIRSDCEYSIKSGDYSSYPEEQRMALCVEDSYKAAPLGTIMSYFFIFLGLSIVLLNRRWLLGGMKRLSNTKDL